MTRGGWSLFFANRAKYSHVMAHSQRSDRRPMCSRSAQSLDYLALLIKFKVSFFGKTEAQPRPCGR